MSKQFGMVSFYERKTDYDAVIVGAGIAGCTASVLFSRRGLRIALIERKPDPNDYKKICTHFIQPSATPTIRRLGLDSLIEAAGGIRNGVEIWTRWGWIRPSPVETAKHSSYGYNIRRQKLDPILRSLAASAPGVEFMPGQTAHRLISTDGRMAGVAVEDTGGRAREIGAQLVVLADGRDSRLAELSGVPKKVRPNNRFAYFAYYRNLPLAAGKKTHLWFLDPDIAYAFPNDDDLTLMACFPTKDKLSAFKADIEGNFVGFIKALPDGPRIEQGERVSELLGIVDFPNVSRALVRPGIALIGDAALASDPVWGVGCGWAFQSAEWLVESTADALLGYGDLLAALKRYQKKHRSSLAAHHFMNCDYATGRHFNPIEKLIYSAAAKDAVIARHLHAYGSRNISVLRFLSPAIIARALWINTKRGR